MSLKLEEVTDVLCMPDVHYHCEKCHDKSYYLEQNGEKYCLSCYEKTFKKTQMLLCAPPICGSS